MNQLSGIEKKLDSVASAIKSLDKTSSKAVNEQKTGRKRIPIDVDALTSEEVDSLNQLIEHEDDLLEYSSARIAAGGDKFAGCMRSSTGSASSPWKRTVAASRFSRWHTEPSKSTTSVRATQSSKGSRNGGTMSSWHPRARPSAESSAYSARFSAFSSASAAGNA